MQKTTKFPKRDGKYENITAMCWLNKTNLTESLKLHPVTSPTQSRFKSPN